MLWSGGYLDKTWGILSELFNANMVKYQQMRLQSLIKKNIQIITALCCNKKRFYSVKMDIYDVLLQLKHRYQTIFGY